jgi:MarR family transcriptional repressor of emrRAB
VPADRARLTNLAGAVGLDLTTAVDAAVLADEGLPPVEAAALTALANFAEGRSIDTVRSALALSQPGCARLADRLVERGLVQRRRATHDRRIVELHLTTAGRTKVEGIGRSRERVLRSRLDVLTDRQAAQAEHILGLLAAASIAPMPTGTDMANRTCRMCDADACGHPDRCPVTQALFR